MHPLMPRCMALLCLWACFSVACIEAKVTETAPPSHMSPPGPSEQLADALHDIFAAMLEGAERGGLT